MANANHDVPIEQQVEYSQILEQVYHKSNDMERKVAPLALLSKDENIVRRAVNIVRSAFFCLSFLFAQYAGSDVYH